MLMDGQLVEIKVSSKTFKHYNELGYNVVIGDTINIPPEHLTKGAHTDVWVVCDICGEVFIKSYSNYLKQHTYDMDVCKKCAHKKAKLTNIQKYGVEYPGQSEQVKEKKKNTSIQKYGCEHPLLSPKVRSKILKTFNERFGGNSPMCSDEIKLKATQSCMEKYGVPYNTLVPEARDKAKETWLSKYGVDSPIKNKEVKNKIVQTNIEKYGVGCVLKNTKIREQVKQTNLEKYGAENPFGANEIKNKIKETLLDRYGVDHPSKSKEIRTRANQTMVENGTVPTSKPQLELYEMVKNIYPNAILNYPLSSLSLDIYISVGGVGIDIEYDGWYYHQNKQRDLKRDMYIRSNGIKIIRIRSGGLLPTQNELIDAINYLVKTEHCFQEIILSDWKENIEKEGDGNGE